MLNVDRLYKHLAALAAIAIAVLASGCGDIVSGTGEQGNVNYALFTDYEVDVSNIRSATIVTGYTQRINVSLTASGEDEVGDSSVTHRVDPSNGIALTILSTGAVPDFEINASEPGTYTVETLLEGDVLDAIELTFAEPESIDFNTMVRTPWSESFSPVPEGAMTSVEEGTEISFVPEPRGPGGTQLVGDVDVEVSFDPSWAVVPGSNINGLYTNGWWSLGGPSTFYIIEPPDDGTVLATIKDSVNGIASTHTFLVDEVDKF